MLEILLILQLMLKGDQPCLRQIASTTTNVINQTKKLTDPKKTKADRTLAAFAAITGAPLKPITVQGAAAKDILTADYKPDGALDAVRHILYRKDKPK